MITMKNNSNLIDVNTYFKEVFTNAGIGIMTLDAKSSIEYVNEEALNIFGYKSSALVNTNFSTLIHSTDQDYLKQSIKAANSSTPSEFTGIHKDNSAFPIELNISSKKLNQTCIYTVIIRDITEIKKK